MTDLRQVAQEALDAWDNPMGMKDLCVAMDALRTALEQQAEPVAVVDEVIHAAWSAGYVEGEKAVLEQQAEPVMLNGLTEAETNTTASVMGLTKQAEPVYRKGCAECDKAKQVQEDDDEWKADLAKGREILARQSAPQQQAEPVGEVIDERGEVDYISYVPPVGTALYASPQQQAEPVACKTLCELCVKRGYDFCANVAKTTPIIISPTPPQRQWVGLTDEDICVCDATSDLPVHDITWGNLQLFARSIEAKLKEKNT